MFLLALVAGVTVSRRRSARRWATSASRRSSFPKPVFHGDTIRVRTEILERAAVEEPHRLRDRDLPARRLNQRDEEVVTAVRTGLMMLRPQAA